MRLLDLKTGETGVIVKILGHGSFRKRMMEMQMAMVQSAQSEQLNEQLNEMELAREGGAGLM